MTQINAYMIGLDYGKFGIDPNNLGCAMLDTENPIVYKHDPNLLDYLTDNEYKSPKLHYAQGLCKDFHVTVRYGFLPVVKRADVESLIAKAGKADVNFPPYWMLRLGAIDVWPSVNGEEYECVVVRVVDDRLAQLHRLLGLLPNITTFSEYKPHITLGYFKPGTWDNLKFGDEQIKWNVEVNGWRFNSVLSE